MYHFRDQTFKVFLNCFSEIGVETWKQTGQKRGFCSGLLSTAVYGHHEAMASTPGSANVLASASVNSYKAEDDPLPSSMIFTAPADRHSEM